MERKKLLKRSVIGLVIFLIIIFLLKPAIGILLLLFFIIVGGGVLVFSELTKPSFKAIRKNHVLEKYGKELGEAILKKQLRIGMTKEMVKLTKGTSDYIKKTEKINNRTEKWYWGKYEFRKTNKYKTYAIIVNDLLTEFGDI